MGKKPERYLTKTVDSQSSNRFIAPLHGIFDQTFVEKGCVATVTLVDHADNNFLFKPLLKRLGGKKQWKPVRLHLKAG